LKRAEDNLDRGRGIPQEEVEEHYESSVKAWRAKSSGRRKHSKTSKR
jgi:hypothetical protein